MAEYLIQEKTLTSLADVVREKIGDTTEIERLIAYISDRANFDIDALPEGLTEIGTHSFKDCTALSLTKLPETVKMIYSEAFAGCTNFTLTELPAALETINGLAFQNCPNVRITKIPASVKSIYGFAFANCTGLTTITFEGTPAGDGIRALDIGIFNGCTNLTTINVPWAEGEVANAPWGATNATINYNYTGGDGA